MWVIDTSVWIDVFRDESTKKKRKLNSFLNDEEVVLAPFTCLELLQGCRGERDWSLMATYLESQEYLEMKEETWVQAARIFFDLRRTGKTVRSSIDCCIAQLCIENKMPLLHRDKDFTTIAKVRPLQQQWMNW
jgi:predicted nucleic acid-binding protein